MALYQLENFVRGDVDASIGAGDTTISVSDASTFPDPSDGNYNLVLWNAGSYQRPDEDPDVEIVQVTGRDTTNDNLTVTRAQEGTSDVAHASSSELQLSVTEKLLQDIDGGELIAHPGEVQSKIDAIDSTGEPGVVKLISGETYGFDTTIDVKPEVTLDFNGSKFTAESNTDMINVHRRARVFNFHYENEAFGSSAVQYPNAIFVFDGGLSGRYYPRFPAVVGDGIIDGGGTEVVFKYTGSSSIYATRASAYIGGADRAVLVNATDSVNGNYINFKGNGMTTAVEFADTSGPIFGNKMDAYIQANSGDDQAWLLNGGSGNLLRGWIFDATNYNNNAWVIGSNAGLNNVIRTFNSGIDRSQVTDNKGNRLNFIQRPLEGKLYPDGEWRYIQTEGLAEESPSSWTNTSYSNVAVASGGFDFSTTPISTTLHGRFMANMENDTAGESTFLKPSLRDESGSNQVLDELEISVTGTGFTMANSGWTEITTSLNDQFHAFVQARGRVSGGTGSLNASNCVLAFGYR